MSNEADTGERNLPQLADTEHSIAPAFLKRPDEPLSPARVRTPENEQPDDGTYTKTETVPPEDVERVFTLLEEAIGNESLGTAQANQLLTVLERSIASPGQIDSETLSELLSMLEAVLVEPEDLESVDVGGVLSIFEKALSTTTTIDEDDLETLFEVIEESLTDPASINPEDVDRFGESVERTLFEMTDVTGAGIAGLFGLSRLLGVDLDDVSTAEEISDDEPIDMFRIARIATGMTQRATDNSIESGVRTGTRMAYATANAQSPVDLLTSARAIALDELQQAGIDIGDEQQEWLDTYEDDMVARRPLTVERLKEQGAELLEESAEVGRDESIHPAFPSLLDALATDEARILRLLATDGGQPVLDVHHRQYIPWKLTLVAENLTMLGSDAGCRTPKRTAVYLQNLQRLGLVTVSNEPVDELKRYQILEAQSHVEAAREQAKRPRTSYKSVQLTDLGIEFCEMCFPFAVEHVSLSRELRDESSD